MTKAKSIKKPATQPVKKPFFLWRFLKSIGSYFKGSWQELRQVRWPNAKATWSLTLAVILFSLFWVAIILSVDVFYQTLFKQIILR